MKLHNKKTGEIGKLHYDPEKEYHFTVVTEDPADFEIYRTLAELNADWEDYKPAEPLIKDEKLRNIIKEWCEYYHISNLQYRPSNGNGGHYLVNELGRYSIDVDIDNLKVHEFYNVEELCGGEEE